MAAILSPALDRRFGRAKVVVWARNSRLGASDMARAGEVNLGQLTRERHPGETILVGFSTHSTAPAERQRAEHPSLDRAHLERLVCPRAFCGGASSRRELSA